MNEFMEGIKRAQNLGGASDCAVTSSLEIQQPTLLGRLRGRRENFAKKITNLDEAIAALEANPETVKIMDLLGKVGSY
jgi:hypothetical protein